MSLLQRHKYLQDKIQSIEGDVARVGVAGDKLKKSQISAEALYLTADPARAEDMEKLVPTEVSGREMPGIYILMIIINRFGRMNHLREQRFKGLSRK